MKEQESAEPAVEHGILPGFIMPGRRKFRTAGEIKSVAGDPQAWKPTRLITWSHHAITRADERLSHINKSYKRVDKAVRKASQQGMISLYAPGWVLARPDFRPEANCGWIALNFDGLNIAVLVTQLQTDSRWWIKIITIITNDIDEEL